MARCAGSSAADAAGSALDKTGSTSRLDIIPLRWQPCTSLCDIRSVDGLLLLICHSACWASEGFTLQRRKGGVGGVALPSGCSGVTYPWWDERLRGGPECGRSCLEGLASAAGAPNPVSHCMKKDSRAEVLVGVVEWQCRLDGVA